MCRELDTGRPKYETRVSVGSTQIKTVEYSENPLFSVRFEFFSWGRSRCSVYCVVRTYHWGGDPKELSLQGYRGGGSLALELPRHFFCAVGTHWETQI